MKQKGWKWMLFAAVYGAAFAVNVGSFTFGWNVEPQHMAATAIYSAACVWALLSGRTDRKLLRLEMAAGVLLAVTGLMAMLVRAGLSVLTVPAVLLAGIFFTPLYGLRGLIVDYDALYGTVIFLGAVWFVIGACFFRKAKDSDHE